jgi:hypothetical protein
MDLMDVQEIKWFSFLSDVELNFYSTISKQLKK